LKLEILLVILDFSEPPLFCNFQFNLAREKIVDYPSIASLI
jgi:hypothetical protein